MLKFGDYVHIEQKRHGCKNEFFTYKVIGMLKSNTFVDIPVQLPTEEKIHDWGLVDVVSCICCGADETTAFRFRVSDVSPIKSDRDFLIEAAQMAYQKHHLGDPDIGWEELGDKLLDALCNAMGDDGYQKWLNKVKKP